jgi:uncharacterized repeat protein (TIGR01451 family)
MQVEQNIVLTKDEARQKPGERSRVGVWMGMPRLATLFLHCCLCLLGSVPLNAQQVIGVPVPANAMVYDPITRKLYVTVGSMGRGTQINSVTVIDPMSGAVGGSVFVGSEPSAIVMSDQSKFLYVATNDGHTVRRLDTRSLTPGPIFPVGDGLSVTTLAPVVGQPDSVLVMRYRPGVSPNDEGIAVYENGAPKPNTVHAGHQLVTGLVPNRLYGYENQISSWDFNLLDVNADGVRSSGHSGSTMSANIGFAGSANGLLVTDNGYVIDPEARHSLGRLPGSNFGMRLCPDGATGKVYMISGVRGNYVLTAFDLRTYQQLGQIPLIVPDGGDAGRLILCGDNTLAFQAGPQVVLIHGDLGSKLPLVDLSIKRSAFPTTLPRDGRITYTLTVTNAGTKPSSGAFVSDALPGSAEVETVKVSQGTGNAANHIVEADLGPLAPGAKATIEVTMRLTATQDLAFTAVVRGQEPDPVPANNITVYSTVKVASVLPDLAGDWTSLRQVSEGAGVNLRATLVGGFTVRNDGKAMAGASTMRFYLSASPVFNAQTSQLLQEISIPSLPGNRSTRVTLEAPLGLGDDATGLFVFAVLDVGNEVAESNKQNNVVRMRVP